MNHLKTFGLAILAMTALLCSVGIASATTLTSPKGTALGVGAKIKVSTGEEFIGLDFNAALACQNLILEGEVSNAGGPEHTVVAPLASAKFTGCNGGLTIQALKPGRLEFHTDGSSANGNGTVTWSGAEITSMGHFFIFGIPITSHCMYYPENTPIGTLIGSTNREGKTATLDFESAALPSGEEPSTGCGIAGGLTGYLRFDTPDYLDID